MSTLKVRNALETHLAAYATTKNIPVVWENISSIPTTSYIKATLYPATTINPSLGVDHQRLVGLFRMTYYSKELNKGVSAVQTVAEDLIALFPRGLQLTSSGVTVWIPNTPSASSIIPEGNYIYLSVDLYYRADIIKNI
jgi:hypothetical protein